MSNKVIYTGATDAQVNWGSCDDPRLRLLEGNEYEVEDRREHSWHTKLKLRGVPGWFNSVCFDEVA
jgi:hypothetical protein